MKALITGSTGMIGSHIVDYLASENYEVTGLARSSSSSRLHSNHSYPIKRCDVLDADAIRKVLRELRPDLIIHMAAQAFNGTSWDVEDYTYQVNVFGVLNVLKAAKEYCPESKILLACSSAEYGDIKPEECPLVENRPLRPVTPYGVTKVAGENIGYQYYCNYGMQIYLPRLFIHVGTGHPPATAIQNFAMQLALIKKGRIEPKIKVGRLDTARDFIDVRDGVAALMLLLQKGSAGDPINICNGTAVRIDEILRLLLDISGLDVEIVNDKGLLRPSDEPVLLGDNSKLRELGWQRKYTMEDTLSAVYADWINRV